MTFEDSQLLERYQVIGVQVQEQNDGLWWEHGIRLQKKNFLSGLTAL